MNKFLSDSKNWRWLGLVLAFLLVINAWVSNGSVSRVVESNAKVAAAHQVLSELQTVLSTMQDAETGQRGFIITGRDNYLEPYRNAVSSIAAHQQKLRDSVRDAQVAEQLPVLDQQIEASLQNFKETIALRQTRGFDAARARILSGQGKARMDAIRSTLASLEKRERALLTQREALAAQNVLAGQITFLVALACNLLFLAGLYALLQAGDARRETAARQLRASSERFRAIVDASSNIVWTTDAAGEFVEEQPSWAKFTGDNWETYRGVGWGAAIHPDDRERVVAVWNEARREQKLYDIEYRTRRADGQWRVMAVRGTPMRGENGEITEWIGTSTDVTDIQRTQRELQQRDQQMQLVLSNAPMILFTVDRNGTFLLSRGQGLQTLGLEQNEVVGRSLFEVYAAFPDVVADVRDALEGRISSKTATYVLGPVTLEGRLSALLDHNGEIVGAIGMTTDVTQRYRAEKERAELSRYNQLLLDSTGEGIFGVDLDGRCTFVNAAGAAKIGVAPAEIEAQILNCDLHELLMHQSADGTGYPRESGPIARCFSSASSIHSEDECLWRADKTSFDARLDVYPMRDGENLTGGVLTFEDITEKKRAEAQLRDSQQQFVNLANSIPQLSWSANPSGKIYWYNQRWYDYTGTTPESMQAPPPDLVHPQYNEAMRESWRAALQNEVSWEYTFPLRRHDGQYRWFLSRAEPERDRRGCVVRWFGTNTDVTDQREIAASLQQSEARKAAILETALDCIVAIDENSRIIEWNPAAEKTFGHTRDEALGQILPELIIPPALREAHLKGMERYFQTGEAVVLGQRVEVPALHRDGHEFPVELSVTRIEGAGPPLFTAYLRDISARKQAEAELAASARLAVLRAQVGLALNRSDDLEEMLTSCAQAIVDHLDATFARVWTLDELENVLYLRASAGMYTRSNRPDERVPVGQFKVGMIAQNRRPYLTNQVVGDPRVADQEWATRESMVAFAGYPLLVENRLLGVLGMFAQHELSDDVLTSLSTVADAIALGVERKRAQTELERAKARAEEASRTKSLFLANMSHELRTPLNAILGYSEMLEEEALDLELENFGPDLGRINAAGKHLLALINDILDLSKIEAGKMDLFLEEFDLSAIIHEVSTLAKPLIEKNNNALEVEIAPDLGAMFADQTKVRQCLFNLLSNAAKFTENGEVKLRVRRETIAALDEATSRQWLVFEVQDSGIGMSADQILQLFQAFTQADASTTRKFGGTGLGLALTRRFCQMMGGDVNVYSVPGQGSTFTINLPAQVSAEAVSEGEPFLSAEAVMRPVVETIGPVVPGTCVLVIDDDPTQRDLMQRFLEKEGFPVQTASSGEQGLALARQLKPLVITLDVMMPGMDGWRVLNVLKNDAELGQIPVILLTMVDDKSRGFALGAADYMTKPVDRSRLSDILQKFICEKPPCPVLLVEDDEPTRAMMRQMLEKQGWLTTEAANGVEALAKLEENRPALILLDLMMPEMDGFEFAERVHRHSHWRNIPIVVLTAKDLSEPERAQLGQHVHQILQKSGQSREELMEQVRALVANTATPSARACET